MTDQAHAAAVLTLLDAENGPPPLVFFDGFVPASTLPPYVVVYFDFDHLEPSLDLQTSGLTATSDRTDCHITCHAVGANSTAARAVAGRVRAALLDVSPAVTGRQSWPIRHVDNQPVQRDESTGVLVMDQVDVYRLSTVPA